MDEMDTITFNVPKELKMDFQIKIIKEKTTMTIEFIKFMKEYIKK